MRLPGLHKLKRTARRIRDELTPGVLILMYHRVAQVKYDPHCLCVTPEHFAEQLDLLSRFSRPMHLLHLVRALRDGRIPHRAVVVTFDDGYADNLYNAVPLLERFDIPATFFVTTGYLGSQGGFWQDGLGTVLIGPQPLPDKLRLVIGGQLYEWTIRDAAHYADNSNGSCRDTKNVQEHGFLVSRLDLYRTLHSLWRPLPDEQRRQLVVDLFSWAGINAVAEPIHRTLSPEEVVRLADGSLIEVGSHTVKHPVLANTREDLQRSEITASKSGLEEMLGHPVTSFAYPYGTRSDYTERTVAIVREAGYTLACSAFPGHIKSRTSAYELPRYAVHNWDGEAFQWWLSEWSCN